MCPFPELWQGKWYTKKELVTVCGLGTVTGLHGANCINARCRYRGTSQEYSRFSKAMGIPQQRERVTVDGLGNIGVGKYTKTVEKSAKSGIIKQGSDGVAEIIKLGKLNTQPLEIEFGKLKTDELIVTNERIEHIRLRHSEDFKLFEKYGLSVVVEPDFMVKDEKNENTVFIIKKLENTNLNLVIKIILETSEKELKNSVMTFYRIREKNLKKLINKNKTLYRKE